MIYKNKKNKQKKIGYKKLLIVAGLFLGILIVLKLTGLVNNTGNSKDSNVSDSTVGPETKGETKQTTPSNKQTTQATDSSGTSDKLTEGQSTKLISPENSLFVSAHTAPKSDTPLASNCVTSPGSSCTIIFSKDGVSKSLPVQTTDKEGVTYWKWTTGKTGLTKGSWTITAKATYGDQTKTASDELQLEVL